MTAILQATHCPAWCQEDQIDIDGTHLGHSCKMADRGIGSKVWVTKTGQEHFIDLDGADDLRPEQAAELVEALVRAVWITDPDYEFPAHADSRDLWPAIGSTVRKHLGAVGVDQITAAMALDITQPEFSMISRGVGIRTFTLHELACVADLVGITLAELVSDIEAAK